MKIRAYLPGPTRGTLWASDGLSAYVVDMRDVIMTEERDLAGSGVYELPEYTAKRFVIEGDFTVTRHADVSVAQDYLDGAALRRLREAQATWANPKEVVVREETREVFTPPVFVIECSAWIGEGATIAEAADKCREALEGKG